MKELLIECKGIKTEKYYIPPFEVREGDFVFIHLENNIESCDVEEKLIAIFTRKEKHENITINKKHTFVKHFKESEFRYRFFPTTVGEYLKKNANSKSKFANKIYEIVWIKKNTKVNTLAGNPRKLISLYSVLSRTNHIIFDLIAQDFEGIEHAARTVKEEIGNKGSAILVDRCDILKKFCTHCIRIEWFIDLKEDIRIFNF